MHGKIENFVEWGRTWADYRCLRAGLLKAGREDLLPSEPRWEQRPLAWWATLREQLGLESRLNLGLSSLFRALFPDETRLVLLAHDADADVKMTIRVIEAYFQRVQGLDLPGWITQYLTRSGEAKG